MGGTFLEFMMRESREYPQFRDVAADYITQLVFMLVVIGSVLVWIVNTFWYTFSMFNGRILPLFTVDGGAVMVAEGIFAVIAIFVCKKYMDKLLLLRIMTYIFSFLICSEVLLLRVHFNLLTQERNESVQAIILSTLLVFILIFLAMPKLSQSLIICSGIVISLMAPAFLPGKEAFFILPNATFGVCTIFAYYIYRHLVVTLARKTKAFGYERQLYHSLTVQSLTTIANTIDAKDYYTHGHSRRVGEYSRLLASRMGLNEQAQEEVYFAGLLHDIGKISIPDTILNKDGKLTDEEYAQIKKHPLEGYNILKELKAVPSISQVARWHHERIDGRGYPDSLREEELPLFAKIVGVADAYDAMASVRPYRPQLSVEKIISELTNGRGQQFSPEIANIMLELIAEKVVPIDLEDGHNYLYQAND